MINGIVQDLKDSISQTGLIENLTPSHITVVMLTSLLCAIVIYLIYRNFYRGAVYSENFNVLNVMMTLITSFVIMTISTNLVLSLGMVGALSIVRFRSAVKDPLDIGFLFWAIAAGITSGAGLYPLALVGTVIVAIVYVAFMLIVKGKTTFLLVVKYADEAAAAVDSAAAAIGGRLKSRTAFGGMNELTLQVKTNTADTSFVAKMNGISGVNSTVLMEYVGD